MAVREVVKIDEELCDGCGLCVPSCAEGAIQIIDGKARLISDNLCDGLGACLGDCPQGAITVDKREADEFDEAAVEEHLSKAKESETMPKTETPHTPSSIHAPGHGGGCPGARMLQFNDGPAAESTPTGPQPSALRQWPVQLHLVPPMAPYFQGADLLLAADCTAFAMADFHSKHLNGKSLAVACPKLDQSQEIYLDKLVAMIDQAQINTLTVMIMEVPCCGGLAHLAQEAAARATRKVPVKKMVVGLRGEIKVEEWI
jgi:NAD-dependent dihydropyrimidine dehydrogenase PreA subunit